MPDSEILVAYARSNGRKLKWIGVTAVVYSEEVYYDGDTYRNNFNTLMEPVSVSVSPDAYVTLDDGSTNVSPDEVVDANSDPDTSACPPRKKPKSYTIATITMRHGAGTIDVRVQLNDLVGGALFKEE